MMNSVGFIPSWLDSCTQHLFRLEVSTLRNEHAEFGLVYDAWQIISILNPAGFFNGRSCRLDWWQKFCVWTKWGYRNENREVFPFLFQPIGDVTSSIMFYYSICLILDGSFAWLQASVDYAKQTWSLYVHTTLTCVHGATSASGATQPIKSTLQTPTLCNEAPGETCGHGAPPSCHTNVYNSPPSAASSHLTDNQEQSPTLKLHFKQIPCGCRKKTSSTLRSTCVDIMGRRRTTINNGPFPHQNPLCCCNCKLS